MDHQKLKTLYIFKEKDTMPSCLDNIKSNSRECDVHTCFAMPKSASLTMPLVSTRMLAPLISLKEMMRHKCSNHTSCPNLYNCGQEDANLAIELVATKLRHTHS